ncbi:MAG TPA: S4 domain-containing protein, partial [Flavihumibacter sp.]|nr:S4 domain-containing protein [Flavihumibacter sp.]
HGVDIVSFLAESGIFSSKGEARKMVQNGGISLNKNKVKGIETTVGSSLLLNERYMLIQKGRREYFLVKAV